MSFSRFSGVNIRRNENKKGKHCNHQRNKKCSKVLGRVKLLRNKKLISLSLVRNQPFAPTTVKNGLGQKENCFPVFPFFRSFESQKPSDFPFSLSFLSQNANEGRQKWGNSSLSSFFSLFLTTLPCEIHLRWNWVLVLFSQPFSFLLRLVGS
jgi:hypothetical protein